MVIYDIIKGKLIQSPTLAAAGMGHTVFKMSSHHRGTSAARSLLQDRVTYLSSERQTASWGLCTLSREPPALRLSEDGPQPTEQGDIG